MGTPHLEKMSKSDIFEHWEGQQMLENAIREAIRGWWVPLKALSSQQWVKNRGYTLGVKQAPPLILVVLTCTTYLGGVYSSMSSKVDLLWP